MKFFLLFYLFFVLNSSFVHNYDAVNSTNVYPEEEQRVYDKVLFLCKISNISPNDFPMYGAVLDNLSESEKNIFVKIINKHTKSYNAAQSEDVAEIPYSRTIVAIFSFPLFIAGLFGLHRFALGYKVIGIIQILMMTLGIVYLIFPIINFVWVCIDFFRICAGKLQFQDGSKTLWFDNHFIRKSGNNYSN